jgi:hypothetical protein
VLQKGLHSDADHRWYVVIRYDLCAKPGARSQSDTSAGSFKNAVVEPCHHCPTLNEACWQNQRIYSLLIYVTQSLVISER